MSVSFLRCLFLPGLQCSPKINMNIRSQAKCERSMSCFLFSVQRSMSINTRSTGRELRISLNSSKGFSSSRLFAWCLLHQGSQSTIISTSWSSFSRLVSSTDPRIRCHISRPPYSIAVSRGDWSLQSLFGSNLPNIQIQSFSRPFNKKQSSPSVKK